MNGRILYLAIADGRGHLMRAHLLRELLAGHGVTVDIVTTSEDGARFLEALGSPSRLLPNSPQLQFDDRHRLDVRRTRAALLRYLRPSGVRRELRTLEAWAEGADLVVNDSMHLALLFASAWRPKLRVVQVVGENIFRSATEFVRGEGSAVLRGMGASLISAAFGRSFARIFHSLSPALSTTARTWRLPPITAAPRAAPREGRTAAVYLNPHYASPEIAEAVERAIRSAGLALHGVSEVFAARPGWRATDPRFVDAVANASVLVSGAGMAALEQSRLFGVPLVTLLGDQPEQARNVAEASADPERPRCVAVSAASSSLTAELTAAVHAAAAAPRRPPLHELPAIQQAWAGAFLALIHAARTEAAHDGVAGHRDGESEGRRRAR